MPICRPAMGRPIDCTRVLYIYCRKQPCPGVVHERRLRGLGGGWRYGGFVGPQISANQWHCIETHVGPPSASTPLQLWVDGVSAGTLTANFSASSTFDHISLGYLYYVANAQQWHVLRGRSGRCQLLHRATWHRLYAAQRAPAVRDGTGADISTTSSTTQLSANWDASTDAESGISGYQYAIGTSAGGTQTVNWTSLGNVTTVTKIGLTLTNGQTYFLQCHCHQRRRTHRQPPRIPMGRQCRRPTSRRPAPARGTRWHRGRHLDHQFYHAIVGQLGRQHG